RKSNENREISQKRYARPTASEPGPGGKSPVDVERYLRCFEETQFDLKSSEYFLKAAKQVLSILCAVKLERIVCLGLGKILECPISRHQLAFIRCLREELGFGGPIEYFDPVFCEQAVEILERLGGVVLRENCEGKYLAEVATLFYLPHCPKQISNNLLWKNWNSQQLGNIFLIGNSFAGIVANCPRRLLENNARFILEVEDFCREVPFDNTFKHTDIFNDTSLHYFDNANLKDKPEEFWDSPEPHYTEEDLELITRNIQQGLTLTGNGSNKSNEQHLEEASD
ncbi:SRR1-like protein, partial [Aedes aegypti]|uniref:SRR1 domain-containing protein n=1 Tax=Aedes aegypti TaxID=7159 RepID=A0A1S4EVT9_AEDAE